MDVHAWRPMLAVAGRAGEVDTGYAYEFKWDGARALAFIEGDRPERLTLRSRSGAEVTARYRELAGLAAAIGRPAVLDAEVVAIDADGRPSFEALQPRLHLDDRARAAAIAERRPVALLIFDLLALDGEPQLAVPYEQRRERLRELVPASERWQVPPATDDLAAATSIADQRQLEGVIAKRLGSPYRPGARSRDWIKLRRSARQELVVGGWRPGRRSLAGGIGSLLVGHHDHEGLRYAGAVGSGLTAPSTARLAARFTATSTSPFVDRVPHDDARFVAPEVVVEVRFTEWTADGRLRHPVYLGMRDDRDPAEVTREPRG